MYVKQFDDKNISMNPELIKVSSILKHPPHVDRR